MSWSVDCKVVTFLSLLNMKLVPNKLLTQNTSFLTLVATSSASAATIYMLIRTSFATVVMISAASCDSLRFFISTAVK